jgi:hypothetical protein
MLIHAEIKKENDKITIYGSNREIKTFEKIPDWSNEPETAFMYRNCIYFLSEFTNIHNKVWFPNPPKWMKEYDGILNDSAFSGVLIKVNVDQETIKAYTFH